MKRTHKGATRYIYIYIYPQGADTEPPVRETVAQSKWRQRPQRVRSVVHAIERTSFSDEKSSV